MWVQGDASVRPLSARLRYEYITCMPAFKMPALTFVHPFDLDIEFCLWRKSKDFCTNSRMSVATSFALSRACWKGCQQLITQRQKKGKWRLNSKKVAKIPETLHQSSETMIVLL
jgi:hypothetical protein